MGAATVAAALMEHVVSAAVMGAAMVAAALMEHVVGAAVTQAAMVAAVRTAIVHKATVIIGPAEVAGANMARVWEAVASTDVVIPFGPRRRISPAREYSCNPKQGIVFVCQCAEKVKMLESMSVVLVT